ncbi:MAG: hypothetical protein IIX88_06745 [Firmicutes bacterium]|nr:hypothetical protein [Bacillota bacterium]
MRNCDKETSRKGSVSILLMILLSSVILIFLLLYEDASLRTLQSAVQWNGQYAGNTVLSYYLPELKGRYDLYGIWKEPSVLEWRMKHFVENSSPFWNGDQKHSLMKAKCEELSADPENFLLMDPKAVQKQIVQVMEQGAWIDLIQQSQLISHLSTVLTQAGEGMERKEEGSWIPAQRDGENGSEGRSQEETKAELLEQKWDQLNREVHKREQEGEAILEEIPFDEGKTLEDPLRISQLPSRSMPSYGKEFTGKLLNRKPELWREIIGTSLSMDLYALHYFGNCVERQDGWFLYQLEYILQGELSDEQNLEKTKRELFLLRTVLNLASIHQKEEVLQSIQALASAAAPIPYPVAFALLAAAFSAEEAGDDVRILMKGEKLPMIQNGDEENTPGLSYENHLHLLLLLRSQETKTVRMMDLIQLDLQRTFGESFTLNDLCVGFQWELKANLNTSLGEVKGWTGEGVCRYGS